MTKTLAESRKKYDDVARKHVIDVFRKIMADPDFGLSLTRSVSTRLKKSVQARKNGEYKNLSEVL